MSIKPNIVWHAYLQKLMNYFQIIWNRYGPLKFSEMSNYYWILRSGFQINGCAPTKAKALCVIWFLIALLFLCARNGMNTIFHNKSYWLLICEDYVFKRIQWSYELFSIRRTFSIKGWKFVTSKTIWSFDNFCTWIPKRFDFFLRE